MEEDKRKIAASETQREHWLTLVPDKNKPFIETNALIARFMGYEIDDTNLFFSGVHYYRMTEDMPYSECTIDNVRSCTEGFVFHYTGFIERRYDNDYFWLMQVIEKIEKNYDVSISNWRGIKGQELAEVLTHVDICHPHNIRRVIPRKENVDKLRAIYDAVVDFIKWHNSPVNRFVRFEK